VVANARRDPSWQPPATVGGFAAGVFVVLVVVPVVLLFTVPLPPTGRRALLEYVAGHKLGVAAAGGLFGIASERHLTGTDRAAATERPRSRP
jgi:hypothetical protein